MAQTLMTDLIVPEIKMIDLKQKIEDIDVLFVFGVEGGMTCKSLSSWLTKEEGRFLVFIEEGEAQFLHAKTLPLAQDLKVRLLYYKKEDVEIFQQLSWEFVFLRFGYTVCNSQESTSAQEFFVQLEHAHRGIDLLASDCEDMGLKVLTNAIKNLSHLPHSRMGLLLEGKCRGMPAIVCGAGPSLNEVIPLLATLKNKAVIIAGGSSVRALNAHSIHPHLCAHVDPHPPFQRFKEQDSFESPLIYQGRFCHAMLDRVHSPLIWMPDSGSYPLEAWMAGECGIFSERFDGGWTVSNFCTSLALHLGCSTVIFVGMDFSCGEDALYAPQMAGEENRDSLIELEKNKLYSKKDWLMSAEWTSLFAKKNPEIHWINATQGGIDLPGIERRDLSEIAEDFLEREWDIDGMMHSLVAETCLSGVSLEKVAEVRHRVKESFEKSLKLCEDLLGVWQKYYPHSPLEKGDYLVLEYELEEQISYIHFLAPLWNVWKKPILRTMFHPLGQHVHRLLFFKKALEIHLPHLRSYS